MSSSRLPAKVLMPIAGKPLLGYLLDRVRPAKTVEHWVVATSTDVSDEPVAKFCTSMGVTCFRGSLQDVLDRYYRCALRYQLEAIVRITADCPLHHFAVVDLAVRSFHESGADYFTNSFPPTFEDGFDTEVMRFECLEHAWREAHTPYEREHVTVAIRNDARWHREFRKFLPGYDYKLSVDTPDDFAVVSRIIEVLSPREPLFTMVDVVHAIEANPAWGVARAGQQAGVSA